MDGYWFSGDDNKPKHPLESGQPAAAALGVTHLCSTKLKPGENGLHFATGLTSALHLGIYGPICWTVTLPDQYLMDTTLGPFYATWGSANQRHYVTRKDFIEPLINALTTIMPSLDPANKFHVRAFHELDFAINYLGIGNRTMAWMYAHQALMDCTASDTHRVSIGTEWGKIENALQAAWLAAP